MKLADKDVNVFLPNISNTLSTHISCLSIVGTHGESASGRPPLPNVIYCIFWDLDSFSFLTNRTFFSFLNKRRGCVRTITNTHTLTIKTGIHIYDFIICLKKIYRKRGGWSSAIMGIGIFINRKTIYFY